MRTPPLLMGGALLFWGWQTGLFMWGALLAAALEGARLTRTRWNFSNADLNRISDLCWVLCVGAALVLYSTEDRLIFVFKLSQWLPFCFSPLMLAQAYGNRATMPLSVFWWLLRRSPSSPAARKSYNISFCYFAFCLLAASASTQANGFFYPGITLLIALALTSARPRRVSWTAWVTLLLVVAVAGQLSHKELRRAQDAMEGVLGAWIAALFRSMPDNRECQTKIGYQGPIPLSGKIALRVRPEPGGYVPPLLREATWDAYRKETWSASNNDFSMVHTGNNDIVKLLPTNTLSSEVEIARYYEDGAGTLVLPHGTFEIDDVPALVKTNRLGVAMIESGPGLLDVRAFFGPGRSFDSPPCERDLMVPEVEKPALSKVVADLKMQGMTERQKIRAIERFFANHFTYSLNPPRHRNRLNQATWLSYFLNISHTGHCEYFATATVLLLRQAGVSARYVTGYAVPESALRGDTYLVRERHEHAWALAYHRDTGLWEQIDTTPSNWDKAKAAQPPWWEPASDTLSNLYFQFSKWRWNKTSYARYTSWLLVPLILYLLGRIMLNQRRQNLASGADDAARRTAWPGLDSELYLINRQLAAAQLSRLPNEPLLSWQQRLELAFPDSARLRRIFHLHRSLRFDPRGLKKDERETLRNEAQRWLVEFTARTRAEKTVQ
jgi:hypothetical protein